MLLMWFFSWFQFGFEWSWQKKKNKKSYLNGVYGVLIPWHVIQTLWSEVERLRFPVFLWALRPFFNGSTRTAVPKAPLPFPATWFPHFWVSLNLHGEPWGLTDPSDTSLPPHGDWQEVFEQVNHSSRNTLWVAAFLELDNAPFLDFHDLLSNIPKSGLSFEILQDTPKHIPCF